MMATTNNHGLIHNQVGKEQLVQGSLYFGPVSNIFAGAATIQEKDEAQIQDKDISSSLAFPEMLDRRNNIEEPYHGTCQWMFQLKSFQDWHAGSSGLLWIKGKPGAGKSTLMSLLYHKLRDRHTPDSGVCLDFFFSARGAELQHTFQGMLRSLLKQIFDQDHDVRPAIRKACEEKCTSLGDDALKSRDWHWQVPELKRLLSAAIIASAQKRQATIFIDALDEAGVQSAREIIQFLHQISERAALASAAIKICVSSRHYPVSSSHKGVEVTVEEHNDQDIQAYIHENLGIEHLATTVEERAQWQTLETAVLNRSQGIFQWVRLVIPIMLKQIDELGSPRAAMAVLDQVPQELEDVYTHILQNMIDSRYRQQSLILFEWIHAAKVPIRTVNLGYILNDDELILENSEQLNAQVRRRVKTYSGGLIELISIKDSYVKDYVQVIHQTVRDFLTVKGLNLLATLESQATSETDQQLMEVERDDPVKRCHATIYWRCLEYLADTLGAQRLETDEPFHDLKLPKFALYASSFLFSHAAEAAESRSRNLELEINLLKDIFLHAMLARIENLNFPHASRLGRGSTLLHFLATTGLADLVRYVVDAESNIGINPYSGQTYAAFVDSVDLYGRSPFYIASGLRRGHLCETLLLAGADINIVTKDQMTPLMQVMGDGKGAEFVLWLIENGAAVDQEIQGTGTALLEAIRRGWHSAVKLLIGAGANVDGPSAQLYTPLSAAIYMGHRDVVRILLHAGADVNAQRFGMVKGPGWMIGLREGSRSLEARRNYQYWYHSDHATDSEYESDYGTALSIAALFKRDISMTELLLQAEASTNVPFRSQSLMQGLVDAACFDLAHLLLRYGAINDTQWNPHFDVKQRGGSSGYHKSGRQKSHR